MEEPATMGYTFFTVIKSEAHDETTHSSGINKN